jgi:hypothetical protein
VNTRAIAASRSRRIISGDTSDSCRFNISCPP